MNQLYRLILILLMGLCSAKAQTITGNISDQSGNALPFASIYLAEEKTGTSADDQGNFELKLPGNKETYTLRISFMGFLNQEIKINPDQLSKTLEVKLEELPNTMDEVVVSGTLKAMSKMASPVPVEVYSPAFFKKNPTTNVYEALQNVNGVRPQLNCQVCNTGDIHINGLEGPYTMVLIDGMPIVSSLATVYGLSGIPNSIIERMEVVKGPASSLYGSEAIGGLINIITTDPATAPMFSLDLMSTTWLEHNIDLSGRFTLGDKVDVLTGINYFNYDNPVDLNKDNFTDLALQERFSLFQKYRIKRDHGRLFTLAGRYYTENRWGGEMQWTSEDKGGTDVYGETIQTERWEAMGQYQLPFEEKLLFSFSANGHYQDSAYGDLLYVADQKIGFGQLTWDQENQHHNWLAGTAVRYTYYDDNSPATEIPQSNFLPGIFLQDLIKFSEKNELLLGARWDYHMEHGNIFTPRIAYKHNFSPDAVFRVNAGTGFRVVNLFTEDHAALTGSRDVVILEDLKPEQSYNINLNFSQRYYLNQGGYFNLDFSSWYTYFTNLILPDYESNTNQIIYKNLDGHAESLGLSLQADLYTSTGFSANLGATLMDVSSIEEGVKNRQLLTESFSATWTLSYRFPRTNFAVDYTGNLYGPMELPTLGPLDPRPSESPWWSIQNIQFTYDSGNFEFYTGVKNLLNWTPWKNMEEPIIARAFDPFDKEVIFDDNGVAQASPGNPNALTFDPSYVYAPNQGIRGFAGMRYKLY